MRRGVALVARLRRAILPVIAVVVSLALWRTTAGSASSCGFFLSELFGFAPVKVQFMPTQFLPPGSVVWLIDGKAVTWDLANGSKSTDIPTYTTGCFGSCNTAPKVTYTFTNPGYRMVVMQCKSAGSTYSSSAQGVLVLPPMEQTVLLIVAGAVALSVIKALSVSSRRRMAAAARLAAPPVSRPTAAVEGSMTHRPSDLRPRNRFRLRRPQAYATSTPDPPASLAADSPPSPIQLDPGQGFPIMTGAPGVGPRPPGPVQGLILSEANGVVTLAWQQPDFDANRDSLRGFQIFQLKYTGHNTVPEEVLQAAVTPNTLGWIGQIGQSSIHSRQDVVGYVVKPLYQSLIGQTQGLQYTGPGSTASIAA